MKLMAVMIVAMLTACTIGGCSSKQINETTDEIVTDVKDFGEKVTEKRE